MAQKPSIPKGTRDFGPREAAERNYIFDTVRSVFRSYGYAQIETPAMENLSTLLGKYGEEGDKLLYRILNSGDAFAGADFEKPLTPQVCEKGLRYDLTVPFARFVVQHQGELSFPFKRFQIQLVWRADRPQKGRYREFYQCDVDAIGSRSQLCELELVQIVDAVFAKLGVRVLVKINNRKVLTGLAEICGFPDKVVDITVAIDKLDKIGLDAVKDEMREKGLTDAAIAVLEPVLTLSGGTEEKLARMRALMGASEIGMKGLDELEELFGLIAAAKLYRPFAGARPQLLHRRHLRGQGPGLADRQHLRRRPLRQPHRHLRPARHVRGGRELRCRPHLRRAERAGQVPRGPGRLGHAAVCEHGRGRGALPAARRRRAALGRGVRGTLPGRCEAEEAV